MADRLHVLIDGRVQGVGFRYATHHQAIALDLSGWVRNTPDGRVEAEFEGVKPSLEAMLEWCRQGPSFARVTHVETQWISGDTLYNRFTIRS